MNSQPPLNNLSSNRFYAIAMLLAALIGTLAQVVVIPPTWKSWPYEEPKPQPSVTPVPTPTKAETFQSQINVCGTWLSMTSQKRYDFVCQGQGAFEIYEVSDKGLSKNGSGKLTEEGNVEADLLSMPKNRRAHLRLKLSADGRRMEGTWQGEDPRESGQLMFHRV
ncbi:MAG TPA: hypothetical protein VIQ24_23905 [Pyrinomonadaceae bacterium]